MAYIKIGGVASFTDAWIETLPYKDTARQKDVASFTDAWIETTLAKLIATSCVSHLLQMRGLKPLQSMLRQLGNGRIFYRCVD